MPRRASADCVLSPVCLLPDKHVPRALHVAGQQEIGYPPSASEAPDASQQDCTCSSNGFAQLVQQCYSCRKPGGPARKFPGRHRGDGSRGSAISNPLCRCNEVLVLCYKLPELLRPCKDLAQIHLAFYSLGACSPPGKCSIATGQLRELSLPSSRPGVCLELGLSVAIVIV